jgi:hypothetical protein
MITADAVAATFTHSLRTAPVREQPYRHWFLKGCLPEGAIENLLTLPFVAPDLGGVSGKRELHNNERTYFDVANQQRFPVVKAIAEGFQRRSVTQSIETICGTRLAGSYLRIEYAQDTDGFWLEPHTDLGVKLFTLLLYISTDPSHKDLGTDIYDTDKRHVGRSPFESNGAMLFIPSNITFHGFEKRPIKGVRKSVIINYVTNEWRAREQLAFPEQPVG